MDQNSKREKELALIRMEWQQIFGIPITFERVDNFLRNYNRNAY